MPPTRETIDLLSDRRAAPRELTVVSDMSVRTRLSIFQFPV